MGSWTLFFWKCMGMSVGSKWDGAQKARVTLVKTYFANYLQGAPSC